MLLNRVDNFFYNTKQVASLAQFYANTLGLAVRREQTLNPGLMWTEINVGGMEMSFRLADGVQEQHPDTKNNFLETAPGGGATISFEVSNTDMVREKLIDRGVKLIGEPLNCTDGHEIISVFQDNSGRPVQLYEPRFETSEFAFAVTQRMGSQGLDASLFAANIRDIRDLALSIAMYSDDLAETKEFYSTILELPLILENEKRLVFLLDGTTIEFRKIGSAEGLDELRPSSGGVVAIEVWHLNTSRKHLSQRGITFVSKVFQLDSSKRSGKRIAFRDPDGNLAELWQR